MKAIGYIRVSTSEQANQGVSLKVQRAKIEAYCITKDFELVGIIEDAGRSAKDLKRPGVQEILCLASSKAIDAVIIVNLDRMFRNTTDALNTAREFDKRGVALHSIQESLDTRSAMGKFFFTLTAALAEMERGLISERTKAALNHKRKKGEKTGGDVPYGFDVVNGKLVPNLNEQKVKRQIVALREQGLSLQKIADNLNCGQISTKQGCAWSGVQVRRVLKAA